ncbi:helix-turn-helix domain-containing protein [Plantibacter sp. YIM 135249]|uniref:helix-turn-helix domain-containing protein n=1 Tax=Plantibacter sp. YIM 135249 TaxID=3423918 RepID=UPI003D34DAC7
MNDDMHVTAQGRWTEWLIAELDKRGWKQADLVKASGGAIKRDRVSKWVNGKERPTHRNAIVIANVLGADAAQALAAASFDSSTTLVTPVPLPVDLARFTDEQLVSELARRMKERSEDVSGDLHDEDFDVNHEDMRKKDVALVAKRGKRKIDQDYAE